VRHTSEANQALLRARTFKDLLKVQTNLVRASMESFHDQNLKIAETTSRMAMRPLDALKQTTVEQAVD
jgi:hypothetical protein